MVAWSFRLLGELEAINRNVSVRLGSGRLRVVLATLLLQAGQTVSRDELVDRLWDHTPPARAGHTVQTHVMRLRQTLSDPDLIVTRPGGYLIEVEPDELDLCSFRAIVEKAARLDSAAANRALRKALSLWRGRALAGVPSESLRRDYLPQLEEERLQTLERRIELDLELGGYSAVIAELTAVTAQHPFRERFWYDLILALFREGRRAEALTCYRRLRELLGEELGIEPCSALQRLHRSVLNNDDRCLSPRQPLRPCPASWQPVWCRHNTQETG